MYFLTPSIWLFYGVLYIMVFCTCTFAVHGVAKCRTQLSDWTGVLYIKITSILGTSSSFVISGVLLQYHKKKFFQEKNWKQQWTDVLDYEK